MWFSFNTEADMTAKPLVPGSESQKQRPADQLVISTEENKIELTEKELNGVTGGLGVDGGIEGESQDYKHKN
jgi:bacteriocin-like protein